MSAKFELINVSHIESSDGNGKSVEASNGELGKSKSRSSDDEDLDGGESHSEE